MTDSEHCPTRLLSDEPASEDTFGGPHERLATAIADLIRNEDGGKAIGLEGDWGAGKSTVVRLVTQRLEGDGAGDTRVAVFDVWAHQGDPLRRTFLEKLIRHMQNAGWVHCDNWDERVGHLTKRRREETQRVIPQLTGYGIAFALSLLAIPTGSALIAAGATALTAENASTSGATRFLWIGLVGVLAPLFVLVAAGIHRWVRRRGESGAKAADDHSGGLPALVTGQSTTESRTLVTETHDPTSVEFESIFRDLCDEALEDDGERQLVLTIDNLDRVDPENALAVWSTLQTFLQYSEHERPKWFRRLWVLVPFDRTGILSLWGDGTAGEREGAVAQSFLDKTFQIRFRIPPPAISNWRNYLSAALAEALPEHSEEDFHGVYRAFALRKGLEAAQPKPRDLKLFVNEIGAVHRQWQHADGLTLSDLACFVLLQRDEVAETALRSAAEDADALFAEEVLGDGWRDTLAVLYFNAPVRQAREMFLRDPIEAALSTADGEALHALEAAHGDGFWVVFEDSVPAGAGEWGDVGPQDFARAATALDTSGLFGDSAAPQRREAASVLERVRAAAVAVRAWQPFTEEAAEGLVSLCRVAGTETSFTEQLLSAVAAADIQQEQEEPSGAQVSPHRWMSAAFVLLRGLDELGVASALRVPLSADQWLEVAPQFRSDDPGGRLWQRLELIEAEEIDAALSQRSTPEQIDNDTVSLFEVTLRTQAADSLTSTANQLVDSVRSPPGVNAQEIALLMRALTACRSADLVDDETYEHLATEGFLLPHLYQAVSEAHAEAAARCAFAYLRSIPDAREPNQHVGNSPAGREPLLELLRNPDSVPGALDEFVAVVGQDGGLRELARILDEEPPEPTLLNEAFGDLIENDPAANDPWFIHEHWGKIRSNLPDPEDGDATDAFEEFVRDLPSLADVSALIVDGRFEPDGAPLYSTILRAGGDGALSAWCAVGLRSVAAETWAESLNENGDLGALLLELHRRRETIELGTDYLDGLTSHARAAVNADGDSGNRDSLPELVEFLGDENKELLTRRAYEVLEGADGKAKRPFFDLYGGLVAAKGFLLTQRGFVDHVCRPLLVQNNADGLSWLADVFRSAPDLLGEHSDRSAVQDFRSRVRSALGPMGEGEEVSEAVRGLADALGIEPEPPEPTSDESESEAGHAEPTGSTPLASVG